MSDLTFDWKLYDGTSGVGNAGKSSGRGTTGWQRKWSMTKFAIGSDGMIKKTIRQNGGDGVLLVLANFANTQGLVRSGQNDFTATLFPDRLSLVAQALVVVAP